MNAAIGKYLGVTLAVFAAVAFLLLISEFKAGARIAQFGLVIAIVIVALRHESQIIGYFQSIEGKPSA
jgi:hypothetical protein